MRKSTEQSARVPWRYKPLIVVLAILVVLSAGGLAARYIYLALAEPAQTTTTVPGNLIGEQAVSLSGPGDTAGTEQPDNGTQPGTPADQADAQTPAGQTDAQDGQTSAEPQAAYLELYAGRPDANRRFEARDMLPGDSLTQYFCVKAYHDADVTLHFRTRVTEEAEALGDVLHIKVTQLDTDEVLCDGPFSQVKDEAFGTLLTASDAGESTAYYQIDVSLDTAVGNEYQQARLLADFEWYIEEEGGLTPPPTGEAVNTALWIALAVSGALLVVLLLFRRRKGEESHG